MITYNRNMNLFGKLQYEQLYYTVFIADTYGKYSTVFNPEEVIVFAPTDK